MRLGRLMAGCAGLRISPCTFPSVVQRLASAKAASYIMNFLRFVIVYQALYPFDDKHDSLATHTFSPQHQLQRAEQSPIVDVNHDTNACTTPSHPFFCHHNSHLVVVLSVSCQDLVMTSGQRELPCHSYDLFCRRGRRQGIAHKGASL